MLGRVHERELEDDHPQPRPASGTPPALAQLAQEARRRLARRSPGRCIAPANTAPAPNVARRRRSPSPARRAATITPPTAAPRTTLEFSASRSSAFACWSSGGRDGLRDDPGRGGEEERGRDAVQRGEHDQLPELGVGRSGAARRRSPASSRSPRSRRPSPGSAAAGRPRSRRRAGRRPAAPSGRRARRPRSDRRARSGRGRRTRARSAPSRSRRRRRRGRGRAGGTRARRAAGADP